MKQKEEKKPWSTKMPLFARISAKERIGFFRYLGIMTESGVPLEKSIATIHSQTRSTAMHRALHIMLADAAAGEFLSTSLKKMPHLFDALIIQLVGVGEESGTLTQTFLHISEYLDKARDLRGKITAALLYPIIVVIGTLGIALYMLFVLLPQLRPLFTSLNVKLPWTTRVVLTVSTFVIDKWPFLLIGVIVAAIILSLLLRVKKFRYAVDWLMIRLPIFGPVVVKTQITEFSRIISTMLKSGINIVEAFKIASEAINNRVYRRSLKQIASSIQEGQSISTYLLKEHRLFPPFVSQMVSVGEETGRLDESFLYLANFSEKEVDDATKNLTTLLEPLLMVGIGIMVGFIAISIITPIYQLTTGISTVH